MIDEGVIKFSMDWEESKPFAGAEMEALIEMRNRLFKANLIGVYPDSGIGFGNVSLRTKNGFFISGTQTGNIAEADERHFCKVTAFNPEKNTVSCIGPVKASSESMTHGVIYSCAPEIGAVIHVHNEDLWEDIMGIVPTTDEDVPYGTPEMSAAVRELYDAGPFQRTPILAMAGHESGVICYGKDLETAAAVLREWYWNDF